MVRTQIQLEQKQAEALRRLAGQRRISMAEAIRNAVDAYVASGSADDRAAQRERALAAIGAFSADPRLSETHDEAFAQEDRGR